MSEAWIYYMKRIFNHGRVFVRAITLALALVLLPSLLSSCSVRRVGDYTVYTETVMTVAGFKVTHDEYRSFYLSTMASLENGDGTIWYEEDAPVDELKQLTEASIRKKYAIRYMAKKYGVKLTSADKKDVNATVGYYIEENGGADGYRQWLTSAGMTGRIFREHYELIYFYDEYLRDILLTGIDDLIKVDDETVKKDIEENFYHYTWIFIPFEEGDNYSSNGAYAKEALEKLDRGEDFYEVAKKYSDWKGNATIGIYATKGEKVKLLEDAALKLKEGEYSRVLAFDEGHAILMRLPMDQSYINSNFDDFIYQSATRRYNELMEEIAAELEVEYTDYYYTLTMDALTSNKGYIITE